MHVEETILSSEIYDDLSGKVEHRFVESKLVLENTSLVHIDELWLVNGVLHRDDEPAVIRWDREHTHKLREYYYKNGLIHRDGDEPAEIGYGSFGNSKTWYKNGQRQRDNGLPPKVKYYKTGEVKREIWYDREPSCLFYSKEGIVCEKIHNKKMYVLCDNNEFKELIPLLD